MSAIPNSACNHPTKSKSGFLPKIIGLSNPIGLCDGVPPFIAEYVRSPKALYIILKSSEFILPNIDFIVENKRVVLIDDVLYTGRTIRSGIDAMMAYGRPASVELLTLVDRRFKRQLPIQADYVGKTIDTLATERVNVEWKEVEGEDKVVLFTQERDSNG